MERFIIARKAPHGRWIRKEFFFFLGRFRNAASFSYKPLSFAIRENGVREGREIVTRRGVEMHNKCDNHDKRGSAGNNRSPDILQFEALLARFCVISEIINKKANTRSERKEKECSPDCRAIRFLLLPLTFMALELFFSFVSFYWVNNFNFSNSSQGRRESFFSRLTVGRVFFRISSRTVLGMCQPETKCWQIKVIFEASCLRKLISWNVGSCQYIKQSQYLMSVETRKSLAASPFPSFQ